jgi:hypothetical protein
MAFTFGARGPSGDPFDTNSGINFDGVGNFNFAPPLPGKNFVQGGVNFTAPASGEYSLLLNVAGSAPRDSELGVSLKSTAVGGFQPFFGPISPQGGPQTFKFDRVVNMNLGDTISLNLSSTSTLTSGSVNWVMTPVHRPPAAVPEPSDILGYFGAFVIICAFIRKRKKTKIA